MCVSRSLLLASAAWLVLGVTAAHAADVGRLNLLASEAVEVLGHSAATPSRTGLLVLIGIPVTTMLAAFLGTWFGIRGLSFGSLRHKDGWREVAYRFRSEEPMTVGKDVIRRMSGVLDDIEDLGKRIRTRSSAPDPSTPATVFATPRPPAPTPTLAPALPVREVTFARRDEAPAPVPSAEAPWPAEAPVYAGTPRRAAVPAAAARPIARPTEREPDRGTRYRRARALLDDGHDRETVRSMTGLKLAELDLLRCTGVPIGESS